MNKGLKYGAAASTVIAGILHLTLVPMMLGFNNINSAVFFLVSGIAQIFWALPMIREWGRGWYGVGIGGTVILIILWAITRVENPITNRALPVNELGIAVEAFQVAFIILASIMLGKAKAVKAKAKKTDTERP